jgi:hypothetical protein
MKNRRKNEEKEIKEEENIVCYAVLIEKEKEKYNKKGE